MRQVHPHLSLPICYACSSKSSVSSFSTNRELLSSSCIALIPHINEETEMLNRCSRHWALVPDLPTTELRLESLPLVGKTQGERRCRLGGRNTRRNLQGLQGTQVSGKGNPRKLGVVFDGTSFSSSPCLYEVHYGGAEDGWGQERM